MFKVNVKKYRLGAACFADLEDFADIVLLVLQILRVQSVLFEADFVVAVVLLVKYFYSADNLNFPYKSIWDGFPCQGTIRNP